MAKVRHHHFRARISLALLIKVGVAKHDVIGANLKVGAATAPPTIEETPPVDICLKIKMNAHIFMKLIKYMTMV